MCSVTAGRSGIVREYDIRGIAGSQVSAALAERLAGAFADRLAEAGTVGPVAVGRDCRVSSEDLASAFGRGLVDSGVDVIDLGICPTPLMYFALHRLELAGGVQVTASHNPADHNGFKLCLGRDTVWGADLRDLWARCERGARVAPRRRGRRWPVEVVPDYHAFVRANTPLAGQRRRLVVDAGNGTGGVVAVPLLESMGFAVTPLFCEMDGRFPNHPPDPTVLPHLSALIDAVRAGGAMLGIAYDGDADRLIAVDEAGGVLWGDLLLILFARDLLARHPGAAVVGEVKCSERLYRDIRAHGGRDVMWRTGHSVLKQKLRDENALLAGEMSGHLFFADRYFGYDDAIYASVRLLDVLLRDGRPASALLADLPPAHATPEIRIAAPVVALEAVVREAHARFARRHKVDATDGVRVLFDPDGWGLIRRSHTEPVLSLRFEASSPERLAAILCEAGVELDAIDRELDAGLDRAGLAELAAAGARAM